MKAPTFQHRHYVKIAEIIAAMPEEYRHYVAGFFSTALKGTNPNYDVARFGAAASGNPSNGRDKRKSR